MTSTRERAQWLTKELVQAHRDLIKEGLPQWRKAHWLAVQLTDTQGTWHPSINTRWFSEGYLLLPGKALLLNLHTGDVHLPDNISNNYNLKKPIPAPETNLLNLDTSTIDPQEGLTELTKELAEQCHPEAGTYSGVT